MNLIWCICLYYYDFRREIVELKLSDVVNGISLGILILSTFVHPTCRGRSRGGSQGTREHPLHRLQYIDIATASLMYSGRSRRDWLDSNDPLSIGPG